MIKTVAPQIISGGGPTIISGGASTIKETKIIEGVSGESVRRVAFEFYFCGEFASTEIFLLT